MGVRKPRMHDDDVCCLVQGVAAIGMPHFDIGVAFEMASSLAHKRLFAIERHDLSRGSDQLGQDRRIVPRGAANLDDTLARLDMEHVEYASPKARQAVVQSTALVDSD